MIKIGLKIQPQHESLSLDKNCIYEIATQRQQDKKYVIFDDNNETTYFDEDELGYFKKVDNQLERNQEQRQSGGSTHYYELPKNATELKDLIRYKKMTHPIGEIFCSIYRLHDNGEYKRNLQKAKFYIDSELEYLEKEEKEIRC